MEKNIAARLTQYITELSPYQSRDSLPQRVVESLYDIGSSTPFGEYLMLLVGDHSLIGFPITRVEVRLSTIYFRLNVQLLFVSCWLSTSRFQPTQACTWSQC